MLHLSIFAHLLFKFLDVMFLPLSKGALESGLVYVKSTEFEDVLGKDEPVSHRHALRSVNIQ